MRDLLYVGRRGVPFAVFGGLRFGGSVVALGAFRASCASWSVLGRLFARPDRPSAPLGVIGVLSEAICRFPFPLFAGRQLFPSPHLDLLSYIPPPSARAACRFLVAFLPVSL